MRFTEIPDFCVRYLSLVNGLLLVYFGPRITCAWVSVELTIGIFFSNEHDTVQNCFVRKISISNTVYRSLYVHWCSLSYTQGAVCIFCGYFLFFLGARGTIPSQYIEMGVFLSLTVLGSNAVFLASISVNMGNFAEKHRGKVSES